MSDGQFTWPFREMTQSVAGRTLPICRSRRTCRRWRAEHLCGSWLTPLTFRPSASLHSTRLWIIDHYSGRIFKNVDAGALTPFESERVRIEDRSVCYKTHGWRCAGNVLCGAIIGQWNDYPDCMVIGYRENRKRSKILGVFRCRSRSRNDTRITARISCRSHFTDEAWIIPPETCHVLQGLWNVLDRN